MSTDMDIETLLSRHPLVKPSAMLDHRIDRLFDASRPPIAPQPHRAAEQRRWRLFGSAAGMALAASLILVGSMALGPLTQPAAAPYSPAADALAGGPVEIEEVWSELVPGELAEIDGRTVRTYELQQWQIKRWVDPKTNVEIEVTVPTSNVILASLQID